MNAVLANDTSGTSNPGCQGTIACLMDGLRDRGIAVTATLPIGYATELFSRCFKSPPPVRFVRRLANRLSMVNSKPPTAYNRQIDPAKWLDAVQHLRLRIAHAWADAELLVINGEGTIHHNSIGALTLVGLCAAARQTGKRVALVNCSVMELEDLLLDALRDSVDFISVREPESFRYLKSKNIDATQSADCLFLMNRQCSANSGPGPSAENPRSYVVYTPGVLAGSSAVNDQLISSDIQALKTYGLNVYYFIVEAEDERFASAAVQSGARILPLGSRPFGQVQHLLQNAKWVVSGRYHINIFSSLLGTPFVPLETNTFKMRGLLELLGHHSARSVRPWRSPSADTVPATIGPESAINVPETSVSKCISLAQDFASFRT